MKVRLAGCLNSVALFWLVGLHVMLVSIIEADAAVLTADQLLDQKKEELKRFVAAVEANARNCGAVKGCGQDTCSRLACYNYGIQDDPNYVCIGVQNNSACGTSCKHRNFDYSRSFLRRVDEVDAHIARTVCTHRSLDDTFKSSSMADKSHFFRVLFGAADGTFRVYPGTNEDCDSSPYDARLRPWYIESTYVPKAVTVLIDSGLNMRIKLSGGTKDETYGSKAIATAMKILDTLREGQDYVTFVSFDGDGRRPLNATMIYNSTTLYYSFKDRLPSIVGNGSQSYTNATSTIDAITATITELQSSTSIPATYLKVAIVLTTGQQFSQTNLSQINIPNSGVNLFVYNFLSTNRAAQCNQAIQASMEEIPAERIDNPLFALQSYYSFLANVHRSFMGDDIDYGQKYQAFLDIDNSTLTLSKAAFGPNGELVGVLGINMFEEKVDEQYPTIQFQSIVDASRARQPLAAFNTRNLNTSVCFNHTDACPGIDATYVQGFLCEPKSGDKKIGCCGGCGTIEPRCRGFKCKLGRNVGIIVGGFVGLVIVIVIGILIVKKCLRRRNNAARPNGAGPVSNPVVANADPGSYAGEPNAGQQPHPGEAEQLPNAGVADATKQANVDDANARRDQILAATTARLNKGAEVPQAEEAEAPQAEEAEAQPRLENVLVTSHSRVGGPKTK